jgi:hypothetical protein
MPRGRIPKPNPTLVGTSRFPHSPVWLFYEPEILHWWLILRDVLVQPIPINPLDSQLLHAEKEVLEFWYHMRDKL